MEIEHVEDTAIVTTNGHGWLGNWFKWCPTSMALLRAAEKHILSYVKTKYRGHYINVGSVVGDIDNKIWTISLNEQNKKIPLVLLHGLGSGVALWCLNLDPFAANRPVHAIDILGFGCSSRPSFSTDALEAERQLVQSVEEWRREMRLDKFVLLGHSMGGFLATSYAIRYPDRVAHLVLADPWGFPEKPSDVAQHFQIPVWVKAIAYVVQPFNPLWTLRAAGPWGPKLIEKIRPDLVRKFEPYIQDHNTAIPNYIFHCNAQNPSGEAAFHAMMSSFGWAKYPMVNRIDSLRGDVPISLIYGSRSWVEHSPGAQIQDMRPGSSVDIQIINGAGHHLYCDKWEQFNNIVLNACEQAEKNLSQRHYHRKSEPKSSPILEGSIHLKPPEPSFIPTVIINKPDED